VRPDQEAGWPRVEPFRSSLPLAIGPLGSVATSQLPAERRHKARKFMALL